jgi:hypothetical protein
MKRFTIVLLVLVLGLCAVNTSYAQAHRMWAGPAVGLNIPLGSDFYGVGFSFTGRFQYDINAMMAVGGEVGYATWSGKDITIPGFGTVSTGTSFGAVPINVFAKYYFMPSPPSITSMRWYGILPLGVAIGTSTGAGTSFQIAPGIGIEYPIAAGGRTQLDASVGYYGVFASGSTLSNIYIRVGANFAIN